ncbi:MAG: Cytochrome c-type biogenesis protein CcmE [Phycisphaerae bacterium]|nr:Cytochrome c-type biogenesis protein CcmE [Phycisphaerae bacterium]
MRHMKIKLGVGAAVVLLAVGFLAYAGVRKAQVYYMEVDQFLADHDAQGQRVRLCGTVADGSIQRNESDLSLKFELAGREHRIPVHYSGQVPDLFAAGGEVVVEGTLGGDGVFEAATLMTKCASKYKPEDYPAKKTETGK